MPASLNISVGTLAPPVISVNTSVCQGETNQVYSTQPGKINYLWSIPAQAQVTTGGTPYDHFVGVIWVDAGNYLITVNYSVASIPNAAAYLWQYSGSGVLTTNNGTEFIQVSF